VVLCEYFSLYHDPSASSQSWTSSALYLNYTFTPAFALALRSEYFTDHDGIIVFTDADPVTYSGGANIFSLTLSANLHLGQLTVIPEFRMDQADRFIFNKPNNSPAKGSTRVLLGAYYAF
ncbi:MAG: outer membrane beta-barrel protein, partial [Thermoflavifilum sp.]|nr:outer membrane beta-barrel protein [Thermoflavifilum sp.]